jgi:hypothetical protein
MYTRAGETAAAGIAPAAPACYTGIVKFVTISAKEDVGCDTRRWATIFG